MKKRVRNFLVPVLMGVLLVAASCDTGKDSHHEPQPPVNISDVPRDTVKFSDFYELENIEYTARIPVIGLPMAPTDIDNLADFQDKLALPDGALAAVEERAFVVMDNPVNPGEEYMSRVYENLRTLEVPVFITTDSLLHLYHIQFDETLRIIEEREFYDAIWDISLALLEHFDNLAAAGSGDVREAAERNAAYFSVGLELLRPKPDQVCDSDEYTCNNWEAMFRPEDLDHYVFDVPSYAEESVEKETELMEAHAGFSTSHIFRYPEDYSQYVPRGHYTRSERLKNYFKAFMWYGRLSFLLKGDLIVSGDPDHDARIQTAGAALITSAFAGIEDVKQKWDRIYSVTSFYVGTSDDLGPYEYLDAMQHVFGDNFSPDSLTDETILALKAKLAEYRAPQIYGGTGNCQIPPPFTPEQADECLESTKGFRLMGQRFIPDSYMFSNLVGTYTDVYEGDGQPFTLVISGAGRPIRGFPRGLDVMAMLGSERAARILDELDDTNYARYDEAFSALKEEFDAFGEEDWNKNLYWSWLYSLRALLGDFDEGYPTFMRQEAWTDKEITTALASWAELRHDTILYAKQSYTPGETSIPEVPPRVVGYVEPVPGFYNRLLALTRMTNGGLGSMGVLDDASTSRLAHLEEILLRLVDISVRELEDQELNDSDYDFINDFADHLAGVIADVDDKAKKTTMVADVHTDANTMNVLEEGVGYIKLMVVAYRVPDGRILVGAGPVMSYYEFKHPASDRLTDEAWRDLLEADPPANVEWYAGFGL
jgi:hypothetical protein